MRASSQKSLALSGPSQSALPRLARILFRGRRRYIRSCSHISLRDSKLLSRQQSPSQLTLHVASAEDDTSAESHQEPTHIIHFRAMEGADLAGSEEKKNLKTSGQDETKNSAKRMRVSRSSHDDSPDDRRKHSKRRKHKKRKRKHSSSSSDDASSSSDSSESSRRERRHRKKRKSKRHKRKRHRDDESSSSSDGEGVRRSVITGKKIRMTIEKTDEDRAQEAARQQLLEFMNSSYK